MAASRNPRSPHSIEPPPGKRPFDVARALPLLREATRPYPKAALFELAAESYDSVFEILIACIISIRTHDATVSTQPRLLALAPALSHAGVN
jgi:endonuclease-3